MRENSLHKGTALGHSLGDLGQGVLLFLCPSGTGSGAGVGWSSCLLSLPQRGAFLGVENQGGLQCGPRQCGAVSLAPPRRSSGRLSVTTRGIYCFMSAHICLTLCDFSPRPQICDWPVNSIQVLVTAFLGRVYPVPLESPRPLYIPPVNCPRPQRPDSVASVLISAAAPSSEALLGWACAPTWPRDCRSPHCWVCSGICSLSSSSGPRPPSPPSLHNPPGASPSTVHLAQSQRSSFNFFQLSCNLFEGRVFLKHY